MDIKKILLIFFCAFSQVTYGGDRYTLSCRITGKKVREARLSFFDFRLAKEQNITVLSNGFSITDTLSGPFLCKINFPEYGCHTELLIDTGKIKLDIVIDSFVRGGQKQYVAKIQNKYISEINEIQKFGLAQLTSIGESELDQVTKGDLTYHLFDSLISRYPRYIFLARLFSQLDYISYKNAVLLYGKFNERLKSVAKAYRSEGFLQRLERTETGTRYQSFPEKDSTGKMISPEELKFTYAFIDFGSSTCIPCRAQYPELKKIFSSFAGKGFMIIGNYLEFDKGSWLRSLRTDSLPWITVSSVQGFKSQAALYYGLTYIPYNILVDEKLNIIGRNYSPQELNRKLEELLK